MLQADSARNRLIGIGLLSLSCMLFTLLDGTAKWLVVVGGLPVIVVAWLRFLSHAVFAGVLLFPLQRMSLVKSQHWRWHLARGAMLSTMLGVHFWVIQHLQLAALSAIGFLVPILVALIASRVLGEKLDLGRWLTILAGFAGVLVIVQPGSADFHPAMLVAVVNTLLSALFLLTTRRLAAYDSPETIQYLPAVVATLLLAPFAIAAWRWPEGWLQWTLACAIGVFGALANQCVALAHRYAPATVVAPFIYQQVIYMALCGYLVFGDTPSPTMWIGAAMVVGCGLYLFHRERARRTPSLDC